MIPTKMPKRFMRELGEIQQTMKWISEIKEYLNEANIRKTDILNKIKFRQVIFYCD